MAQIVSPKTLTVIAGSGATRYGAVRRCFTPTYPVSVTAPVSVSWLHAYVPSPINVMSNVLAPSAMFRADVVQVTVPVPSVVPVQRAGVAWAGPNTNDTLSPGIGAFPLLGSVSVAVNVMEEPLVPTEGPV